MTFRKEDLLIVITVIGAAVDIVCMLDSVARPVRLVHCHINTAGTYTKLMPRVTNK
jgi:hypothetical protein